MEQRRSWMRFPLLAALASACVAAAGVNGKGLQGRFVGRATIDGARKLAVLDLVKTGAGIYRGGCTLKESVDDPGLSCSAEARDMRRGRAQILLRCVDDSRQEWRAASSGVGKS